MENKYSEIVVIIVNYNSLNDTKSCIQSLASTNSVNDLFLILIDNNSKEDIQILKNEFPRIKIIKNKSNIGFGRANNVGINWAQRNINFKYILLLNNDTIVNSNSIDELTIPFKLNKNIGITTAKTMFESDRNYVWYGGGKLNKYRGFPEIFDYNNFATPNGADKEREVTFVSGCVMMISNACISKLKGFDEDYFMYFEDLELSLRCSKEGFKLWYTPRSVIYHKVGGSVNEESLKKEHRGYSIHNPNLNFLFYNMKLNQYRTMKKHLSTHEFLIFKFVFWVEYLFKGFTLSIRKPSFLLTLIRTAKKIIFLKK